MVSQYGQEAALYLRSIRRLLHTFSLASHTVANLFYERIFFRQEKGHPRRMSNSQILAQ